MTFVKLVSHKNSEEFFIPHGDAAIFVVSPLFVW